MQLGPSIVLKRKTLNGQAKSAALSVFEGAKQRFFAALLSGLKTATLIKSIEADLETGHAAIVQLVSTGEAILDRRLSEIPAEEWADLNVDLSPRDVILTYLQHAFPTQLYEPYTDEDGNLRSRPAFDAEGNPIQCREAVASRDRMIERLASLDPVPGALDQIIQAHCPGAGGGRRHKALAARHSGAASAGAFRRAAGAGRTGAGADRQNRRRARAAQGLGPETSSGRAGLAGLRAGVGHVTFRAVSGGLLNRGQMKTRNAPERPQCIIGTRIYGRQSCAARNGYFRSLSTPSSAHSHAKS